MKIVILLLAMTGTAGAQFVPPAMSSYEWNGSLWTPLTTSATLGAVAFTPPAAALYCYNSSTLQWVPADASCFGGGAAASVPFSGVTAGTNTNALVVGAGGTVTPSGGGTITSNVSPVPPWLLYFGDGSEGGQVCNGALSGSGEHWFSSFTVNGGTTCTPTARGVILRVTGACAINGTIDASAVGAATTSLAVYGGGGGGGGGGAATGTNGIPTTTYGSSGGAINTSVGTAGTGGTTGNPGGVGSAVAAPFQKAAAASGIPGDYGWGGGGGGAGGSSGGAAGNGGESLILVCGSLTGTGTIRVDGGYGSPSAANSTGAGGGGGGGVIITRSPADTSTLTFITNGGPPGSNVVPMAQWYGGGNAGLTTTATVTTGTISACSVGGTTTNWLAAPNCKIIGGGGTLATCHFTTSGSSPTLTITGCVVDVAGSGYTAATFTTSNPGGVGGAGWSMRFTQ